MRNCECKEFVPNPYDPRCAVCRGERLSPAEERASLPKPEEGKVYASAHKSENIRDCVSEEGDETDMQAFKRALADYPSQDNEGYLPDRGGFKCGFMAGLKHARTQSQAEIASLKAEVREYRDNLTIIVSQSGTMATVCYMTALGNARELLAKFPEREG